MFESQLVLSMESLCHLSIAMSKYMFFFEPKIIHVEDPIGACQTPMVIIIHLDSNVLQSQDFVAFIFRIEIRLTSF